LASAQYLTLVRNLLVKEVENIINITPLILPEWLNADMNLTAKNIPTKFGIVNFACTCIGKKIVYQFANEFHTKPTELIIHLPMSIKRVTYDQIQRDVFNVYVMVPADVTKVELELA
jgi:hypothetical protein